MALGLALVDLEADDAVMPNEMAELLGVAFYPPTRHSLRWRGQRHSLKYGDITLELSDDDGNLSAWRAGD